MKNHRLIHGLVALGLMLILNTTAFAKLDNITVRDFSLVSSENDPKILIANIQFNYQLTDYLRESLLSGITLRNEIRFDLVWHSEWWFDRNETLDSVVTELKYHALSRQYQLVRQGSEENWNFTNLSAALEYLGRIKNLELPVLPNTAYEQTASIYVEAVLEPEIPQLSLNLSSVFSDKNRLVSQSVLWPITP